MAKQNIFDNETFFEGYRAIRDREGNANDLFEIPALFSLLPDLNGKSILDLGCGFGEHCVEFVNKGASKVVGIDISEKMLEVAKKENSNPAITYMLLPIEDIEMVDGKFDIVISSLAFHYVEDFDGAVKKIYDKLNTGGNFIFHRKTPSIRPIVVRFPVGPGMRMVKRSTLICPTMQGKVSASLSGLLRE